MKNENKTFKSIVKGTFVVGALLGATSLSASNTSSLFSYDVLGSGAEVRSELLHTGSSPFSNLDMACGEKAAKVAKEAKGKVETKAKEAKCGEGTCGGDAKAKVDTTVAKVKAEVKSAGTKVESKAKEMKCGEGKCGK